MVRGLAKLTNYTWKVEAINAGGTSYFTGVNAFVTIIAAPGTPALGSPSANATGLSLNPTFTWGPVVNANKYRLQIATDNAFATIVRDTVVFEDTTCVMANTLNIEVDYFWRVLAGNLGGFGTASTARLFTTGTTDVTDVEGVPGEFALMQNYPNPFNPSTVIRYDVPATASVKIVIYDVLGREVAKLADGVQVAGRYNVTWNASGLATGVYIYRMEARPADGAEAFTSVKKLLLMK